MSFDCSLKGWVWCLESVGGGLDFPDFLFANAVEDGGHEDFFCFLPGGFRLCKSRVWIHAVSRQWPPVLATTTASNLCQGMESGVVTREGRSQVPVVGGFMEGAVREESGP